MDKKQRPAVGLSFGITTVLTVLAVIGLAIFSTLSLTTARQGAQLADKYTAAVTSYWAADCACTDVANALGERWEAGDDAASLGELARELGAETSEADGELLVSYMADAGGQSVIAVTLRIGEGFTVESWKLTNMDENWQPEQYIRVWNGE